MKNRSYALVYLLLVLITCCKPKTEQQVEVRVRLERDPESLNPVNASNTTANQILNLLYQGLLTVDLADGEVKPLLAVEMPQVEVKDSLTFLHYTLRPEASWENNSSITAKDVAFSLKLLKAPLINNQWVKPYFDFIQDIAFNETDPKKFTLICKGYSPDMVMLSGEFAVLPAYQADPEGILEKYSVKELATNSEELSQNAALQAFAAAFNEKTAQKRSAFTGSGGYILQDWKPNSYLRLTRKEKWWADKLASKSAYINAKPEAITFQVIPDINTALLALKNKQLDLLDNIPAVAFKQLQQDQSLQEHFNFFTPETYEVTYLGLNSRLGKFSDKETRQALAYLINTDEVIQVVQNTFATPTVGLISPGDKRYYNKNLQPYRYNTTKATELLQQAGWQKKDNKWQRARNGRQEVLSLQLAYKAGNSVHENTALLLQQSLSGFGVPVTLQAMEGAVFSDQLKNHRFEGFIRSLTGNPFSFNFTPLLHTQSAQPGGLNMTGFGNAYTDSLITAISQTGNEADRTKLLHEFQRVMQQEATMLFLFFNQDRIAVNKQFENLKISGLKPGYDVSAFTKND